MIRRTFWSLGQPRMVLSLWAGNGDARSHTIWLLLDGKVYIAGGSLRLLQMTPRIRLLHGWTVNKSTISYEMH